MSFIRQDAEDLAGNKSAGALLHQINYWYVPHRLKVYHKEHYWIAKDLKAWAKEIRCSISTVQRAIKHLVELGLIETCNKIFNNKKMVHIRLLDKAQNSIKDNRNKQSKKTDQKKSKYTSPSSQNDHSIYKENTKKNTKEIGNSKFKISKGGF